MFHNDKPSILKYFICNCFAAVVTADHFWYLCHIFLTAGLSFGFSAVFRSTDIAHFAYVVMFKWLLLHTGPYAHCTL